MSPVAVSASLSSASIEVHRLPAVRPSNVTVPIITATNAIVPGTISRRGSPASGGRTPTVPSRDSNTEIRESRL